MMNQSRFKTLSLVATFMVVVGWGAVALSVLAAGAVVVATPALFSAAFGMGVNIMGLTQSMTEIATAGAGIVGGLILVGQGEILRCFTHSEKESHIYQ